MNTGNRTTADTAPHESNIIADFHHAPHNTTPPRWLGSLHGGNPEPAALRRVPCGRSMLNATDLHEYLIAVSNLLDLWANDDTATAHRPVDGRPSPWDHDRHARPDLQLLRPGRPRVSPGDLRRTAEASRELIQYL